MTCHLKAKMSVSNNGKALDYISPLFDLKSSAMLGTECPHSYIYFFGK